MTAPSKVAGQKRPAELNHPIIPLLLRSDGTPSLRPSQTEISNLRAVTFAPALANGAAYAPTEWIVSVTNWRVTDPNGVRPLKVAGPGSLRLEEDDPWVTQAGYWEDPSLVAPKVAAYWSMGRALRSAYTRERPETNSKLRC